MKTDRPKGLFVATFLALTVVSLNLLADPAAPQGYTQENLVSDIVNNANHLDANLVNPWGL